MTCSAPGPAIVTNGPPGAGKAGFQRTADPPSSQIGDGSTSVICNGSSPTTTNTCSRT